MRPIVTDMGVALWRLLPANPIVVRVVQGGSKRRRHLWIRIAYLLTLLFVMLLLQMWLGQSGGSLADLAKSSTRMFEYISILQLAMMCFLAPIFTASAISQEQDAETFNVLLTTPLTNAQIVLGSLLSRLFFVVMLLLAGLPIFCITMLFGGVTAEHIFLSFGIAACTAVFTGSLAISVSVIRIGTRTTVFSFFMGIAIYLIAGIGLGMWPRTFVPESVIPGVTDGMSWLAPLHPYLALQVALNHVVAPEAGAVEHYAWPINRIIASPHTAYMVITLLSSALMVGFSTLFVRRGVKQGEKTPISTLLARFRRTTTANGERRQRARRVWSNPVAWREAVTRGTAASSNLVRYSYIVGGAVAALLLLISYKTQALTASETHDWLLGIVLIEFISVLLMAANAAATAIARERESNTIELLLTTPLTSRYIIWGKLRGLVSFTIPLLAVPVITVLLFAITDLLDPPKEPVAHIASALLLPPLLLVYSAVACILGLHMSLKNKGTIQALLATIAILVVAGMGLGLCAYGVVDNAGPLGPLMVPLTFVTGVFFVLSPQDILQNPNWNALQGRQVVIFLVIGTVIAVGLYSAVVAGTYKSMITNFDMIVRKQQR